MRIAFHLVQHEHVLLGEHVLLAELFDANALDGLNLQQGFAKLAFSKDQNGVYNKVLIEANPMYDLKEAAAIIGRIGFTQDRIRNDPKRSVTFIMMTPFQMLSELRVDGARQIAWDPNQNKYRNVSTMRNGESSYLLGGTDLIVSAGNAVQAQNVGLKLIADLIKDQPHNAVKLTQWIIDGRKVGLVKNGAIPSFIKMEEIMTKLDKEATKPEAAKQEAANPEATKPEATKPEATKEATKPNGKAAKK